MNRAEEFEQLRTLLFAIAYRVLGSVGGAEDAVQGTWLRYESKLGGASLVSPFRERRKPWLKPAFDSA